jgi:hypothetical protein
MPEYGRAGLLNRLTEMECQRQLLAPSFGGGYFQCALITQFSLGGACHETVLVYRHAWRPGIVVASEPGSDYY